MAFRSPFRAAVLLALWLAPEVCAQPSEYQVKAAFLLNFTKFIEWPASAFAAAESPFAICILGQDPFGSALDRLIEGETVDGRRLTIQRLQRAPAPRNCQVLFVPAAETDAPRVLSGLNREVLTVGEGEAFLREGGMITFVMENRRVRFAVNLRAADRGELKLSSKLLNVARSVQK